MANKLARLEDIITWGYMTDNNVVFNLNGTFQKTYVFRGADGSNMTENDVNNYYVGLNNIFLRMKDNYYVFAEMHKQISKDIVHSSFTDPLLNEFEQEREKNISKHQIYGNAFYLTICYRWPSEALQRASRMLDKSNKEVWKELKSAMKEFVRLFNPIQSDVNELLKDYATTVKHFSDMEAKFLDECEVITSGLKDYFVELEPCTQQETLTYLHDCISDHHVEVKADIRSLITQRLKDSHFMGGRFPKLGDKYVGIVGVKDFPSDTVDFMFDRLNSLSCEYRFVVRYIALGKDQAVRELKTITAQHEQRQKSFITMVFEAIKGQESPKVDREAVRDAEDAKEALDLLQAGEVGFGYLSFDIVLLNENQKVLKEKLSEVRTIVNDLQFIAEIEKDNATAAWFSTIPPNFENNVRRYLVNSTNFCNIAPMGAYYDGQKKNKHFAELAETIHREGMTFIDDPLIQCSTPEHLPFYFNLHVGDVGHTLVVGPTGAGKSVLLNTISASFRKYPNCKVFVFDKSASSRVLTKAIGGNFYNLLVDNSSISFQPLAHIDETTEKTWVLEWLVNYLEASNVKMTPQKRNTILNALGSVAESPIEERTITALITYLQDEEIRSSLRDLSINGAYGSLFDSNVDKFGAGRWQVFEMEKLMENNRIVAPTLDYLFHRIESQLDGSPALMILDECWLFLRNEAFRNKIVEYLKDLRKKNCSVVMATQNLSDIDDHLLPVVSANCLTKIFLPNTSINDLARNMYERFDLNDTEISILEWMKPKRQYFYKSSLGTRIFDLTLSPLEIAFLGATSKEDQINVSKLDNLSPADFSQRWKALKHVSGG